MLSATATEKCKNCHAREGDRHLTWCAVGRGKKKKPNVELLDTLAEFVGFFGDQQRAQVKVMMSETSVWTLPVPEALQALVERARELLKEKGRAPIAP